MTLLSRLDALEADYAVAKDTGHGERTQAIVDAHPSLSAIARAAVARPWWVNNYVDKHGRDCRGCLGCRRQWYADYGENRDHGSFCPFSKLDAAIDAAEGTE